MRLIAAAWWPRTARSGAFPGSLAGSLDVVDEAHAQHFVGFVQHQGLQLRQVERAFVQVVDHAARGADDDLHAAAQRRQLRAVALAAVDRQHVEVLHVGGVALEGFGDLDRQFARRRQHQRLHGAALDVDARQDRQREGGGLAGTGLRLPQHVAAFHQQRNGGGLDRRRRLVCRPRLNPCAVTGCMPTAASPISAQRSPTKALAYTPTSG
jgi:hypothetical protein